MSTDLVRYSVSGNIAEIMLDRPPVNALSMDPVSYTHLTLPTIYSV